MKNSCFIVLFLLGIIPSAFAQLIGFEEEVPEAFTVSGKGEVKSPPALSASKIRCCLRRVYKQRLPNNWLYPLSYTVPCKWPPMK